MTQTQTATDRCEATTRSGLGCKNGALPGGPWCHGHHPDRAQDRVRIASQGGQARGRPVSENAFSLGAEEQAARDQAVAHANFTARGLDTVIRTRARQLQDEPPPPMPDLAARRARAVKWEWIRWHQWQAAALAAQVRHHEAAAQRLEGRMV